MPYYDLKFKILNYDGCLDSVALLKSIQRVRGVRSVVCIESDTGICSLTVKHKDSSVFSDIADRMRCLGFDTKLVDFRLNEKKVGSSSDSEHSEGFVQGEASLDSNESAKDSLLPEEMLAYKSDRFSIKGMTCGSCAAKIESHVRKFEGVISVKVSVMTSIAVIDYHFSQITSGDLVCIINEFGYSCEYICDDSMDLCIFNIALPELPDSVIFKLYNTINNNKYVSWAQCDRDINVFKFKYDLYAGEIRKLHRQVTNVIGKVVKFVRESTSDRLLKEFDETITLWKWMFIVSLLIGLPSMIIMVIQMILPPNSNYYVFSGLSLFNAIQFLLSLASQIMVGKIFYGIAIKALMNKSANMDTLISLASIVSFLYSIIIMIYDVVTKSLDSSHIFFETSQMLFLFVSLGRYLESIAKKHTLDCIDRLSKSQTEEAILIDITYDDWVRQKMPIDVFFSCRETVIDLSLIQKNDILKVSIGSKFPADGTIIAGVTSVEESLLTGEPFPRNKNIGGNVLAGTTNVGATTWIRVENCGPFTQAETLVEAVTNAQTRKASVQKIADRISLYFVPAIIILGLTTLTIWLIIMFYTRTYRDYSTAEKIKYSFQAAISVLCVACPCALSLAAPTAVMVATGIGAGQGILIKGGDVFQLLSKINCIAFDKTGTLTNGVPVVTGHCVFEECKSNVNMDELWNIIYSIETYSTHPIAKAICNYISQQKTVTTCIRLQHVHSSVGLGLDAYLTNDEKKHFLIKLIDDDEENEMLHISLGNRTHMDEGNMKMPKDFETIIRKFELLMESFVYISYKNQVVGFFRIKDTLRPETQSAVRILQDKRYRLILITGDTETSASAIFKELRIKEAFYGVFPSMKAQIVENFQKIGYVVGFVGDGVNDSLAMATSEVGISLSSNLNLTTEAADVILVNNNLLDLCNAINLAKMTVRRIKINLFFSVIYNIIAVPIAAGCLKPFGLDVQPWMAAGAMATSSLSVVLSSLALRLSKKKYLL